MTQPHASSASEIILRTRAATERRPLVQIDVFDAVASIEGKGGRAAKFWMGEDSEPHYEIEIQGRIYGPMDESGLHWFACGLNVWPRNKGDSRAKHP